MHCNRILHGATTEKAAMRQLQEFQKVVSQLHSESEISPNMLLPRHHYLFLNKSLYHRLQQPYDDIWCWLRSVEEAHLVLLHQKDQHRMDAHWYFPSSPDSTYSASTMPVHHSTPDTNHDLGHSDHNHIYHIRTPSPPGNQISLCLPYLQQLHKIIFLTMSHYGLSADDLCQQAS